MQNPNRLLSHLRHPQGGGDGEGGLTSVPRTERPGLLSSVPPGRVKAVAGHADYLVTKNIRHFPYKMYEHVRIVRIRTFLNALEKEE
jgi:hypothetical protein